MIVQIFNRDVLEVLTVFSLSPGSRFLRKELKERTRLNNINLDKTLNVLINSGLVKKDRRLLSLDIDRVKLVLELVSGEYRYLRGLPLDVYFPVVHMLFFLSRLKDVDAYLFGSYAKLVFKEDSDVDLCVVSDGINVKEKRELNKLVRKLELRFERNIEVHYFGRDFYKNRKDPLVKDIIRNGIRLI
ncbi:MAG: nucleotidyltransferase domain-containing protein [Candidatus Aenigmatarchaeota archaeon]